MKPIALLAIVLIPLTPNLKAELELRGSPEELEAHFSKKIQTITIPGSASQTVEASHLTVQVEISAEGRSNVQALEAHQQAQDDFADQLIKDGITRGQMELPRYSQLRSSGNDRNDIKYRVTGSGVITIELQTQEQYLSLQERIDNEGTAKFLSSEFHHEKENEIAELVFKTACNQVKKQRAAYEENLGMSLEAISMENVSRDVRSGTGFGQIIIESQLDVIFRILPERQLPEDSTQPE